MLGSVFIFEYNKQMMSLLILSRDYGKSDVKASENVLKFKDVSAWDKLIATFPEESDVETKIEEIRNQYINLIILGKLTNLHITR